MAYYVEFVDPVLDYLGRIEGLTDRDREVILDGIVEELSRDADRFHALRPLAHESYCFLYDYALATQQAIYSFDFVVDAAHREMGVMRVVYVECTSEPI